MHKFWAAEAPLERCVDPKDNSFFCPLYPLSLDDLWCQCCILCVLLHLLSSLVLCWHRSPTERSRTIEEKGEETTIRGQLAAKPHVVAHKVVTLVACLASAGCAAWSLLTQEWDIKPTGGWGLGTVPVTLKDPRSFSLYDLSATGVTVTNLNLGYEMYDLMACGFIPDLRKAEMLLHHLVTILLGVFLLRDQYGQAYSVFFMGFSELSTVVLVFVDLFRRFPALAERSPALNTAFRSLFAVVFLVIRVVLWPYIMLIWWREHLIALQVGPFHDNFVVSFTIASGVFLTLLQLYWGSLITKQLSKMLRGEGKGRRRRRGSNGSFSCLKDGEGTTRAVEDSSVGTTASISSNGGRVSPGERKKVL